MSKKSLSKLFYLRETEAVAKDLLGKTLVRIYKGKRLSGRITEVEAYLGIRDRACHTYNGRRTPRTETMYNEGGCAYIYFIYGMHYCLNAVTQKKNTPEAVLIRAIEPIDGIPTMMKLRKTKNPKILTNGPGKLAQALAIDKSLNGISLNSKKLFIENSKDRFKIKKSPRIGIDYAGPHKNWKLRFTISQ